MYDKFFKSIFVVLFIFLLIISVKLYYTNLSLQDQISAKDVFIRKATNNDSSYIERTKKYSDVITKYISDCDIYIDNKKVSTPELINLLNNKFKIIDSLTIELESEKESVKYYENNLEELKPIISEFNEEFENYADSTYLYKTLVDLYKKEYGIEYNYGKKKGSYYFIKKISKADSALILFPYYRNMLKTDSTGRYWLITTEKKAQIAKPANIERKEIFIWPFKKKNK